MTNEEVKAFSSERVWDKKGVNKVLESLKQDITYKEDNNDIEIGDKDEEDKLKVVITDNEEEDSNKEDKDLGDFIVNWIFDLLIDFI